jgi:hypothetical protein
VYLQEAFNYTRQNTARLDYASSFNFINFELIFFVLSLGHFFRSLSLSPITNPLREEEKETRKKKTQGCERKLASKLAISCGWRKQSVSTCRVKLWERRRGQVAHFFAAPLGGLAVLYQLLLYFIIFKKILQEKTSDFEKLASQR